jgi:hypothetical protein
MKIRNINEKHGDPVEFKGETLLDCLLAMEQAILECGHGGSTAGELLESIDYEIVEGKTDKQWANE